MLQKGDVIELKSGHTVYGKLDKRFGGYGHDVILIGHLYHESVPLKKGDEGYDPDFLKKEYAKQQDPNYKGFKGVVGTPSKIISTFDSSIFAGKYVVLYATYDGGGSQGTPSGTEYYPNGYHVFCQQIVNGKICGYEVDFYQSGSFTAMIENIKPVDKVELEYSIKGG
jgi:hypothetical protein